MSGAPQGLGHRGVVLAGVSLGLLALFAWLDGFALWHMTGYQLARRDVPTPGFNAVAYAAAYLAGVAGVAVALTQRRPLVRWLAVAWVASMVAIESGFAAVNGYGYRLHEARLLFDEGEFASQALQQFLSSYVLPLALSVVAALAALRLLRHRSLQVSGALLLVVPLAALAMQGLVLRETLSKVHHFVSPYRVPLLTAWAYTHRAPYYGPREAPRLSPRRPPAIDHVIVVMDESIRGDLLGLNGGEPDTTPFLRGLGDRVVNFGVVPSISNLSATTNIAIQTGLRPGELPDRTHASLRRPTLFQYLQRAGFRSHLIDAQIYSDDPPNHLSGFDLAGLDEHLQIKRLRVGLPAHELDFAAIDQLERILEHDERSFSWVLKLGAHFLYEGKYPPSARRFAPTLAFGEVGRDPERTRNSYLNALAWTVDEFWRALHERLEESGRSVLVIYTSDHGQSLLEIAEDVGRMPHGTVFDPPVYQAMVPLFVVGYGEGEALLERSRSAGEPGAADQFALFPTIMEWAGYDRKELGAGAFGTLFEPLSEETGPDARRRFFSGSIFGEADTWAWNAYEPPEPGTPLAPPTGLE